LRYLESGGAIILEQACMPIPAGVDSADDLERVRKLISGKI
jgi:CMP-2-keto-3-deoxyoctulosonic acid synthetase